MPKGIYIHIGRNHTKKTKRKLSKIAKSIGTGKWNKGKKLSEKTKVKMRKPKSAEARVNISKAKIGKKNPMWKGGHTKEQHKTREFKRWRMKVFSRDNFICQICEKVGGKLNAHHIKRFSSIIQYYEITTLEEALECDELWNINNGITLCEDCHKKTNNYKNKRIKLICLS